MKQGTKKLEIETPSGVVSAILDTPKKVVAGLTLAHGAGAGMNHKFMVELATALTSRGFAVLRFQFPYMEKGKKRTDSPAIATATVAAAVRTLQEQLPGLPLFAAGKSFGARMTTTAAAEGLLTGIQGIICYGFPLHPAGKPGIERAQHLGQVPVRILFLQGTRDDLAEINLIRKVSSQLPKAKLHIVAAADHSFGVLKRSGRSPEEVLKELTDESERFASKG